MNASEFLAEVAQRLRCDRRRAESVTFAVFRELTARLTAKEIDDVAAQLPTPLKRMWQADDVDHPRAVERVHRDQFIGRVRHRAVLGDDGEAERAVRAVFGVVQHALGSADGIDGEAGHVFAQLPTDLKKMWLAANRPA